MDKNQQTLNNKIVVITGASSGLGRGIALQAAQRGASLVLAARRSSLLSTLADECATYGGRAVAVETDVSNPDEVANLHKEALQAFGRVDAWINNAGVGAVGTFNDVPLDDHTQVLKTNLFGSMYGSYEALQTFHKQGYGILVNVASMLGKIPAPYYASYVASKHGIIGLTDALRLELKQKNIKDIHICLVLPMAMNSPFFDHAANYSGHKATPIPPITDVQNGIDAVVRLLEKPQDEIAVGAGSSTSEVMHQMVPGLVEDMTAKIVKITQFVKSPRAPDVRGNVHEPVTAGRGVHSDTSKN